MKLLLFDIDGTLLISNGAGRRAMNRGLAPLLGKSSLSTDGVSFGGRTDPQIISDILRVNGVSEPEIAAMLPDALNAYVTAFTDAFETGFVRALDGAIALVEKLATVDHVQLALLTGNVRKTAYLKVSAIGLDRFFPFGAFGSDYADRGKLPGVAVERALTHNGHEYSGKDIVIIGDTKHDILCGRALNVYSVAVSTGHYNAGDLSKYNPDLLLDDLCDTDHFIETVI